MLNMHHFHLVEKCVEGGGCDDGDEDEGSELGVQVGDIRDGVRSLSAILLQAQLHPGGIGSAGLAGPWASAGLSPSAVTAF